MTYEEALEVLGLSSNFSEEDLTKNYRKLVKMYHPDVATGDTEEKMKQINVAYEILIGKKDTSNYYQSSETNKDIKFKEYCDKKSKLVHASAEFSEHPNIMDFIKAYIDRIQFVAVIMEGKIESADSKEKVDEIYKEYTNDRHDILKALVKDFYLKKYIDEQDVNININYDASLDDFYNTLLRIENQFSKSKKLEKRLQDEIANYRHIPFYDKLKNTFEYAQTFYFNKIVNSNFKDIEKYIKEMNDWIKEAVDGQYDCESRIKKLECVIKDINDLDLKKDFDELKSQFDSGTSVSDIQNLISKLESKIKKYQEEKELEQKIFPIIEKQYNIVLKKYIGVINTIKNSKDIEKINLATDIFKKVIDCLGKINLENIDFLDYLDKITFLDAGEIDFLENNISKKENIDDKNSRGIYILDRDSVYTNDILIGKILSANGDYIEFAGSNCYGETKVNTQYKEEFRYDYVSLEAYLKKAVFMGKRLFFDTAILYYDLYTSIILQYSLHEEQPHIRLTRTKSFEVASCVTQDLVRDAELYKDKEYMKKQVIKYVDELLEDLPSKEVDKKLNLKRH